MKQKKTKQCPDCERFFSPEGLISHKRIVYGYDACKFYTFLANRKKTFDMFNSKEKLS